MARDRQRAKQRKARREKAAGPQPRGSELSQPIREDVPGSVEHIGESDQVDAAIVAGAGGVPAPADAIDPQEGVVAPESLSDEDFAELEDRIDVVEETIETGDDEQIAEVEEQLEEDIEERRADRAAAGGAAPPTKKGRGRLLGFLRASWAELQRVQWPDRRQVGQATAVVLGFVVVAGAYLGVADAVAQKIVDFII